MNTRITLVTAALAAGSPAQVVLEGPEPNDTTSASTLLACGAQGQGRLDAYDVDCWSFVVASPSDVTVYVTGRGALGVASGGTSAEDVVVELLDTDGSTTLAYGDVYAGRPLAQTGFFPRAAVRDLPAGTYFVTVAGFGAFDIGDYAIDLRCEPAGNSPFCAALLPSAPEMEPNDAATANGVRHAACCRESAGTISGSNDQDFWQLDLSSPTRVAWSVEGYNGSPTPLFDPQVAVYAADGTTLLGWNDDVMLGVRDAYLELDLQPATYFVSVTGHAAFTGDYRMTTDCAPLTAVPILADFATAGTTSCIGSSGAALRLAPRANEWPVLNSVYEIDVDGVATTAVILLGTLRLDPAFDLAGVGAPGCGFGVLPVVPPLPAAPSVQDEATFTLSLVGGPNLLGATIRLQAASLDPAANPAGLTTSNSIDLKIGADA